MRKGKSDKIWKDWHIKKYVTILICISSFFIFLFLFFDKLFNPTLSLNYLSIIIILTFFAVLSINVLRINLTFITKEGIKIGNAPDNSYERFRFKQKSSLIKWNNIEEIKI